MPDEIDLSAGLLPEPRKPRRGGISRDRILQIARSDNIPDDIADDFAKVMNFESGGSHFDRRGKVKLSPPDPKTGERAVGAVQIKPSTARGVGVDDPFDEEKNLLAGLRYFRAGGDDPTARRIHYFGGPRPAQQYRRTGRIPKGRDVLGTTFEKYVQSTGGQQKQKPKIDLSAGFEDDELAVGLEDSEQILPAKRQSGIKRQNPPVSANQSKAQSAPSTSPFSRMARRAAQVDQIETIDAGNAVPFDPRTMKSTVLPDRLRASADFSGEEYKNFLRLNRSLDSPRQREAFITLKTKQATAAAGSPDAAVAEMDRQQRVARMPTSAKVAQVAKGIPLGLAQGAGTTLKSIGVAAKKLNLFGEYEGEQASDLATYQAGEYIQKWARDALQSNPDLEKEFWVGQAPQAIGQATTFLLGGLATKAPKLTTVILGGGMVTGDAYDEVKAAGGTDEQAVNAGVLAGAILGPTELLGTWRMIKALEGTPYAGNIKRALAKSLVDGTNDAVWNAVQEAGQEYVQGKITGVPREAGQLLRAAALGAIASGPTTTAISGAGRLLGGRRARQAEAQPDVTAQPETAQREATTDTADVATATPPERAGIPESGIPTEAGTPPVEPQRFYHKDWGEVEVLEDQSGARPGRVKVVEVADPTKQHFPKRADLTGRGNQRMVPVKPEAAEVPNLEAGVVEGIVPPEPTRVYHGSRHDIERFSLQKIGAGEGNQAYGWGLYFTDNKKIAEFYKGAGKTNKWNWPAEKDALNYEELTPTERYLIDWLDTPVNRHVSNRAEAIAGLEAEAQSADRQAWRPQIEEAVQYLKDHPQLDVAEGGGKVYEVELSPQSDEWLDWDKPLSEQSPRVQKALRGAGVFTPDKRANEFYSDLQAKAPGGRSAEGQKVYPEPNPRKASKFLRSIGIRGIRYYTGETRHKTGPKEHNYVLFDDRDVRMAPSELSKPANKISAETTTAAGFKEDLSLSQFVRKMGGIVPAEMYKGELDRLRKKDTGTTGLINQKATQGNVKQTADIMMQSANDAGFRDPKTGQPFENPGDFLMAVERDVLGDKIKVRSGEEDFSKAEAAYYADQEARVLAEESRHNFLAEGRGADLFDRIVERKATDAERHEYTRLAEQAGISQSESEDLISEARREAEDLQETGGERVQPPDRPAEQPTEEVAAQPSVEERSSPEFVNSRKWYHGTSATDLKAEQLDPFFGKHESLMGQGIYLTDSPSIAKGYAGNRARKSGESAVYEAKIDVSKVLDLEAPAPPEVRAILEKHSKSTEEFDENFAEAASKEGATTEDLLQAFRRDVEEYSHQAMVPTSEFVELFQDVNSDMRTAGYDALTHTGGKRTGKAPHRVLILLDPHDVYSRVGRSGQVTSFERVPQSPAKQQPPPTEQLGFVQEGLAQQEAPPPKPITGFTTSQGSTYTVSGQSTQRTKTPHIGHDPKDVGLKRSSEKTVYLDEDAAREVGMWNTMSASGKRVIIHGDEVWLTSENPKTGQRGRDGRFKFTREPEVGKSPLELWETSDSLRKEGKEAYRGNHPGNPIKQIQRSSESPSQRDALRQSEQDRQAQIDPARTEAHAKLAELKRRGLTVDDYARQPDLEGNVPSAEEVAQLRELEAGETPAIPDQPKMFGPGTMRAGEPLPEVKERKFGKRFVEDERIADEIRSEIGTAKYYEPIPNKVTAEQAKKLVDERGLGESIRIIRDEKNDLAPHIRATMGQTVILKLNQTYRNLKAAGSDKADGVLEQAVDLAEWAMDYGTRLGQGVQSFAMWSRLTPEGKLLQYKRFVKKARERHQKMLGEDVAEIVNAINKEGMTDAERLAAIKELLNTNKTAKRVKSDIEKLLKAARGAKLTDEVFYDIVGEKLGLPGYNKETAAHIVDLADRIEAAPEGLPRTKLVLELQKFIAEQKGFDVADLPLGIFYGNILSGYNTHAVNFADTGLNVLSEINGLALNNPQAAAKIYAGMLRGFAEGKWDAMLALTEGRMFRDSKWLDAPGLMEVAKFGQKGGVPIKTETRTGRLAKRAAESKIAIPLNAYKYVSRAMSASDAVMARSASEARATLLAYKMAKDEGLKGDALEARVREILALDREADYEAQAKREGFTGKEAAFRAHELREMARPKDLTADAAEFAGEATYNHTPHGTLGLIAERVGKLADDVKPLKLFVPFTRIVANVTNRGLNYTPYGYKRAIAGWGFGKNAEPLTAEERRLMLTRATMGTAGMVLLGVLQEAGLIAIHGNGPSDREKRRQLQNAGWRPYSLQIGKTYISYVYSPAGLGLSIIGNMKDSTRYHELEQKDAATRGAYAVARLGSTIFSQSFLSGLSRLFGALSEEPSKSVASVKQTLGGTVAAFGVPNIARDMHRLFDNKAYQSTTLAEDLIRNTPFAALALKPTLNAFGEPVKLQRQRFFDIQSSDPAWKFVIEKNLRVPVPGRTIEMEKGRRITPEEYHDLLKTTGPKVKDWIIKNRVRLSKMKEQDAQDELSEAATRIRKFELVKMKMRVRKKAA